MGAGPWSRAVRCRRSATPQRPRAVAGMAPPVPLGRNTPTIRARTYPPVDETLALIGLVRAHPWNAEPLGKDDFDFDHDWRGAEQAAVDVIKALADKDVEFGTRDDEVWAVLEAEARDRGAPS